MIDNVTDEPKSLYMAVLDWAYAVREPRSVESLVAHIKEEDVRLVSELFKDTRSYFQNRYVVTPRGAYKLRAKYNAYMAHWQVVTDCEGFIQKQLEEGKFGPLDALGTFKRELLKHAYSIAEMVVKDPEIRSIDLLPVLESILADMWFFAQCNKPESASDVPDYRKELQAINTAKGLGLPIPTEALFKKWGQGKQEYFKFVLEKYLPGVSVEDYFKSQKVSAPVKVQGADQTEEVM